MEYVCNCEGKKVDLEKRNKIIVENLGLIKKCVREIKKSNMDYEDLVQEAVAMLLESFDRFDPAKGSLSTFIWTNIKLNLLNNTQDMPVNLYKLSQKINKAENYISQKNCCESDRQVAEILGMSLKRLNCYKREIASFNYLYLDNSSSDDNDSETFESTLQDTKELTPEQNSVYLDESRRLSKAFDQLSPVQKEILSLHYNLNNSEDGGLSLREIGRMMDFNHQTVSTQEKKALEKLRKLMESKEIAA